MQEPGNAVVTYEGSLQVPRNARFGLVTARFNDFVVERLLSGALEALRLHGAEPKQIELARVPGCWELPLVCKRLAASGRFDAIIALGAVIRGATPHFDYVAGEAAKGCSQAMLASDVPVVFGILTTDTVDQAIERAGTKAGNKGWHAAASAVEMATLMRTLPGPSTRAKRAR